ncbi:MAG: tetratricopeptide repeat protein [Actinomycetota bacterium]|nr:tetratricopeptide repeat protein [Actinomycetota bacterium]
MTRYLAVVFSDLVRHSESWTRLPREKMVALLAEYRYIAESLAGQYGCLYREWAGDGHMFLFESADAAAQFGLKLIESWRIGSESLPSLAAFPHLPLRLGCHFGECTSLNGEGWIGRGNAVAKRVESQAEFDSLYVTENVLDLLDLPLYEYKSAGACSLKGDHLPTRTLYRLLRFDEALLEARPWEQLRAEDWFLKAVALIGTPEENSEREAEGYREALRLRPDYAEAHNNYAILLRARGQAAEAAKHYHEALRVRPDYPEAHYNYAAMLAARGSTAGAAEHYREALRLRPDYVDAHHGYANLLGGRGELEQAVEHYREALRLRPEYPEAHNNYAILLETLGDYERAAEHFREALRLRPGYPQAHYNYALLLESRDDSAGAEEHYHEAMRLWPGYGEAHNNLAILLQQRGDASGAEEHYRLALEVRPHDPETHYNLALLLRAMGDAEAAERHFRTAYELAPDVPIFRSTLEGE